VVTVEAKVPRKPLFLYDVFLSYRSQDKLRVRRLAERLRAAGLRVFFDDWVIKPGDDIYLTIERGLEETRVQVLCLSQSAMESDWVALERSTVLYRDPSNADRRFVPLLLEDCDLPSTIRRYKFVDFREDTDAAFDELLIACQVPTEQVTAPAEHVADLDAYERRPGFALLPAGGTEAPANTSDAKRAEVRVSFSALLRIQDSGRYLLVNTPLRPEEFSPFGGAYKYLREAKTILDELEFRPQVDGPAMLNDLRGFLPREFLPRLRDWFAKNSGRESFTECLRRELTEESVEIGVGVLPEIDSLRFERVRSVDEGPYSVPPQSYLQYRQFGVYDLSSGGEEAVILEAIGEHSKSNSNLLWATSEEIRRGRAGRRQAIGGHAAYLIGTQRFRFDGPVFPAS
jgi:hypothetical protein